MSHDPIQTPPPPAEDLDERARGVIESYTWGAAAAMVAIPVPGVDMAATFAVWGKMIVEIAKIYGYTVELLDAQKLAAEIFRGVIFAVFAWFASAKTASSVLKFIPGAGTVTAYLVDAGIAGLGAKKITATLGTAAAAYYKSGKALKMSDIASVLKEVASDPKLVTTALSLFTLSELEKKRDSGSGS